MSTGDVVYVALDCVPDRERGGWRTLLRGVFGSMDAAPDPVPGGQRNLVGAFLDIPADGEPGVFWIPEEREDTTP